MKNRMTQKSDKAKICKKIVEEVKQQNLTLLSINDLEY